MKIWDRRVKMTLSMNVEVPGPIMLYRVPGIMFLNKNLAQLHSKFYWTILPFFFFLSKHKTLIWGNIQWLQHYHHVISIIRVPRWFIIFTFRYFLGTEVQCSFKSEPWFRFLYSNHVSTESVLEVRLSHIC